MLDINTSTYTASGAIMGGPWQLRYGPVDGVDPENVARVALEALKQVDLEMSNYRTDSDLARINNAPTGEWVPIPRDMARVMICADEYARQSNGAINIALGHLVNSWGFGPDETPKTAPDVTSLQMQAIQAALGSYALRSDPPSVYKSEMIAFDLCSLAKGFAVDQAARAVAALGITDFLIEAAGEIRVKGARPDGNSWAIGLELPVPGNDRVVYEEITLRDQSVASSGGYRNLRHIDGEDVSHTINPITGAPLVSDLLSVTVLHDECMHADALATVLYVLGPNDGPNFAATNNVAALFLIREPNGFREIRSEAFAAKTRQ